VEGGGRIHDKYLNEWRGMKERRFAGSGAEKVEHANGRGVVLLAMSCCNRDGR